MGIRRAAQEWPPLNSQSEPPAAQRPKIFVVGFNKCGTRTIASYLTANGLPTLHWVVTVDGVRVNVAKQMTDNLAAGKSILSGFEGYVGFSDLNHVTPTEYIEANAYFPHFAAECPDAYFIFNDRDPEDWVVSRYNHPAFAERQCAYYKVEAPELRRIWLDQYERHKAAVLAYFRGSSNFTVFDIDRHGPAELNALLSRHYALDAAHWTVLGKTPAERVKYAKP